MDLKKMGMLIAAGAMFLSATFATSASAATVYSDVNYTIRSYNEIMYLGSGDITTSDKPSYFEADKPMTRAHAAAMIGKALQLDGNKTSTRFTDVPSTNFASGYIQESVERGIILGFTDGTFRPNNTLKRGEMALMISRAFGYESTDTNAAAYELMNKGISAGIGEGNFGIGLTLKRGDFAVFLARAINTGFRVKTNFYTPTQMYVNIDNLNMRVGPNAEFTATHQFFTGQPVEVYYKVGDWVYAKADGKSGFFHSAYLSSEQPSASSTPATPISFDVPDEPWRVEDLVVILDPGHGGHDPGATGYGLKEKSMVLDIGLRAKKYYSQSPIQVKLTREKDVFLELWERPAFAKRNQGDVFVSIHANALYGKATGTETFYYSANNPYGTDSKKLAQYQQYRLVQAWGLNDRGTKYGNYHVLRENSMPAALVEVGFIDHQKDSAYIGSATRREQAAKAIFLGTVDYFYHEEGREDLKPLYSQYNTKPSPNY